LERRGGWLYKRSKQDEWKKRFFVPYRHECKLPADTPASDSIDGQPSEGSYECRLLLCYNGNPFDDTPEVQVEVDDSSLTNDTLEESSFGLDEVFGGDEDGDGAPTIQENPMTKGHSSKGHRRLDPMTLLEGKPNGPGGFSRGRVFSENLPSGAHSHHQSQPFVSLRSAIDLSPGAVESVKLTSSIGVPGSCADNKVIKIQMTQAAGGKCWCLVAPALPPKGKQKGPVVKANAPVQTAHWVALVERLRSEGRKQEDSGASSFTTCLASYALSTIARNYQHDHRQQLHKRSKSDM
jgi:hypothetical protein